MICSFTRKEGTYLYLRAQPKPRLSTEGMRIAVRGAPRKVRRVVVGPRRRLQKRDFDGVRSAGRSRLILIFDV
jgi:uncharacterized protein YcgL (UPF0745 family)